MHAALSSNMTVVFVCSLPTSSRSLPITSASHSAMLALYHLLSKEEMAAILILWLAQVVAAPLSMSTNPHMLSQSYVVCAH